MTNGIGTRVKKGDNIATPEGLNAGNPEVKLLKDIDGDGLNGYEEINIYKTDPNNKDTDGDGFDDGTEVQAWKNPAGEGDLPDPFSTAAGTVIKLKSEVISNKKVETYMNRVNITSEFEEYIISELDLSIEEFKELYSLLLPRRGQNQKFDSINIINIENLDNNIVKVEYEFDGSQQDIVYYKMLSDRGVMYLIEKNDGWYVDLNTELRDNDNFGLKTPLRLVYSKSELERLRGLQKSDIDEDGLSDYEEEYIYGTSSWSEDTDGDGYKDGDEVENGYDPLVNGSVKN